MDRVSKAVISVLGMDRKGIIAKVSQIVFVQGANILDISQTIVGGFFSMVMIVDITDCAFEVLMEELRILGSELGVQIRIQKSEIFEAMHQI